MCSHQYRSGQLVALAHALQAGFQDLLCPEDTRTTLYTCYKNNQDTTFLVGKKILSFPVFPLIPTRTHIHTHTSQLYNHTHMIVNLLTTEIQACQTE